MKNQIRVRTKLARVASCVALLNLAVPGGALVTFGVPLKENVEESLASRAKAAKSLAIRRAKSASRLLSAKEECSLQGKTGENPYLAGQSKWDAVYKGIDLMTGNYSTSVTDLSFDNGYGIPVNVTRSYSANNVDEGPFGKGWTLSADTRSTAGGLLKSGNAPIRSVPVGFKERPSAETDPNAETATGAATQPVEAVVATDAGGDQETVQKDVDGILTTPPWDTNVNENTQYETILQSGAVYQLMTHNETVTGEGTRYVYDKKGVFTSPGTHPWNDLTATAQPANVMKIVSATDRHGNVTTYTYGTTDFTYLKSNGTTSEKPLIGVAMPGGHTITFAWGTTGDATGRLISATDNGYPTPRSVVYQYSTGGLLWKVTTPALKTTTYGYGSSVSVVNGVDSGVANDLLTSITDPRGLTTSIAYYVEKDMVLPLNYEQKAVRAYKLSFPGGQSTYVFYRGEYQGYAAGSNGYAPRGYPSGTLPLVPILSGDVRVFDLDASGNRMNAFGVWADPSSTQVAVNFTPYQADYGYTQAGFGSPRPTSIKTYDVKTMNLVTDQECTIVNAGVMGVPRLINRHWGDDGMASQGTITSTTYNFEGKPLDVTTSEYHQLWSSYYWLSPVTTRTYSTNYCYWGPEKYFQQKAIRDSAGRYSLTDYYLNTDPSAGRRGQTSRVYDAKNGTLIVTSNPSFPVPGYAAAGTEWRYRIRPSDPMAFSGQFDYDAQGRNTDVWKLQKFAPGFYYVQTHTTYGINAYPTWGQASQVVEDYGAGKTNRTTENLAYTSWGKASRIRDAAGHEFETSFDNDGLVLKVQQMDTTPVKDIATYSYGSTAGTVSYGKPVSITDGLSGVTQTIAYTTSGGGIGQPSSMSETNGTDTYSVGYTYGVTGNRATTTYTTANGGTTRWGYADYVYRGNLLASSPAFQTMVKLDNSGNRTPEELHYDYTSSGQLRSAAFAQTPSASTPTSGTYYDASNPAASRGRATYIYDDGGRLTSLAHTWETSPLSGGSSTSDNYTIYPLLKNECDYELSGSNRAVKIASRFYKQNPSAPSSWLSERTETYGYDASLDYLTSANYGDGLANATPTWTYDPAGNRNDAATDNLNRATSVGGSACTNDILGNRLTKNGFTLGWDAQNRLLTVDGTDPVTSNKIETYNVYRADGMRVASERQSTQTLYRYDGQMGFEDEDFDFDYVTRTVTKYGLGARGIDLMERTVGSTVTTGFPMYDAHGNNIGTLSRSGSTFAVNDRRSYDAWGVIRAQQSAGDPTLRYCGSLGHKQDDDTGLIYMRARYYEPSAGRFVNGDPGCHGSNWFIYAGNNPNDYVDQTGKEEMSSFLASNGMLGSLQAIGVSNLAGDVAIVEGHLMAEVTMFEGQAAAGTGPLTTQAINIIRQWAMGNGINALTFQGIAATRLGERAMEIAVDAINAAGDKGDLTRSGAFTYIYWLMQG